MFKNGDVAGPTITLNPESIKALNRSLSEKNGENGHADVEPKRPPTRKGFVPVEKKIQKELSEMKERENELRYDCSCEFIYLFFLLIIGKLIRFCLIVVDCIVE